jgi:hypothetical protein
MKTTPASGLTFLETLMIVGLLGLVATVALPNFLAARSENQKKASISNLRRPGTAKTALASHVRKGDAAVLIDQDLVGLDKYLRQKPSPPAGGTCDYGAISTNSACTMAALNGHLL